MSDTRDPLENAIDRTAQREAISRAVNKERRRCSTIAESFAVQGGGADGEGEIYIARRIADLIRTGPVYS